MAVYQVTCEKCGVVITGHGNNEAEARVNAETELCYHALDNHDKPEKKE